MASTTTVRACTLLAVAVIAGCTSSDVAPPQADFEGLARIDSRVEWDVPFLKQRDFYPIGESACQPTSVAMLVQYYYPQSDISPHTVYHSGTQAYSYDGPAIGYENVSVASGWDRDPGCSVVEPEFRPYYSSSCVDGAMYTGARGLNGAASYLAAWHLDSSVISSVDELYSAIEGGPALGHVYGEGNPSYGHYLVVIGIDPGTDLTTRSDDLIIVNDPYDQWGTGGAHGDARQIPYGEFFGGWWRDGLQVWPLDPAPVRDRSVVVDTSNEVTSQTSPHRFDVDLTATLPNGDHLWNLYYGQTGTAVGDWCYPNEDGHNARWTPGLTDGTYAVFAEYPADSYSGTIHYNVYDSSGHSLASKDVNQWAASTTPVSTFLAEAALGSGVFVEAQGVPGGTNVDRIRFEARCVASPNVGALGGPADQDVTEAYTHAHVKWDGQLGCPTSDVVEEPASGATVFVQYFDQPDPAQQFPGSEGDTALVAPTDAGSTTRAYLLRSGFWGVYKSLAVWLGRSDYGGPRLLGAPVADESPAAYAQCDESETFGACAESVQLFERGCMWFNHVDPALCDSSGCDWDTRACNPDGSRDGLPVVHVHLYDPLRRILVDFSRTRDNLTDITLQVDENPGLDTPVGSCASADQCNDGTCSVLGVPPADTRYMTPSGGSAVFLASESYTSPFLTEQCYYLLYDDFDDIACVADAAVTSLSSRPSPCQTGFTLRSTDSPTVYRQEGSVLHPFCGRWTEHDFQASTGTSFDSIVTTDPTHFGIYSAAYPVRAPGIYPQGSRAPQCGDPGYECGVFDDGEGGICFAQLDCGPCPTCGDNTCDPSEDCSSCPGDCGACAELYAGTITTPPGPVPNTSFDIDWTPGTGLNLWAQTALFCQVDGGAWTRETGYDYTPPFTYNTPPPGAVITCKTRTRDGNDHSYFVDSAPVSWTTSSDYPQMRITGMALESSPVPNGCNDTVVTATVINDGAQAGTWRATGWYHPFGTDETSPLAIEARYQPNVILDPGEELPYTFDFDTDQAPLSTGQWQATVVVEDIYNDFYGTTEIGTVDIAASDTAAPSIDQLQVFGYSGTPVSVLPGGVHEVQVQASDDFAIASLEIEWRESGGSWSTIDTQVYDTGCHETEFYSVDWSVSGALSQGLTLEVRATATDVAGQTQAQVTTVETRSNASPDVQFFTPTGSESFLKHSTAAPECIPVDVYVTPGAPIDRIRLGFANASDPSLTTIKKTVSGATGGRIADCLTATETGDDVAVLVRVQDTNGTDFDFLSSPVLVDYPTPPPPWSPVVIEPTQYPLPAPQPGAFPDTWYVDPYPYGASQFSVFRDDNAWWDSGSIEQYREITQLVLDVSDLGLASSSYVLPGWTETADLNDRGSVRFLAVPNGNTSVPTHFFSEVDPAACPSPTSTPCDYSAYVREAEGGTPTPPELLAVYPGLQWNEAPYHAGAVESPSGARLQFVVSGTGAGKVSEIYRATTGAYSQLLQVPGQLRDPSVSNGQVFVFSEDPNGPGWDLTSHVVNESGGTLDSPQVAVAFQDGNSYAQIATDLQDRSLYVFANDDTAQTLNLFTYDGAAWQLVESAPIPLDWRGNTLTRVTPMGLTVSNGAAWAELQVAWSGGNQNLFVPIQAGSGIDLEAAFPKNQVINLDFTVAASGELINATHCEWNLETRLCLQKSVAGTTEDCYSDDPCVEATWSGGSCQLSPVTCPQDGDLCNGPEVCDSAAGGCISDATQAVGCDDGAFCNGTESCSPADGACLLGTPPVVPDAFSCTEDACDDTLDAVTHTPQDDACYVDACHTATCDPSDPSADATTGCVVIERLPDSDGLSCTVDLCDPSDGTTAHVPSPGTCAIDGACYADGDPNPANDCEVCDPALSQTSWSPASTGSVCDDGLFCTENDHCNAGACVGSLRACPVADASCAVATCDEAADTCVTTVASDGTACDDFDACNGNETCQQGVCTPGTPVDTTSTNPCQLLSCDPVLGLQVTPVSGACDADGDGCTVGDYCDAGACVAGPAPTDCAALDNDCNTGICLSTGADAYRCVLDPAPHEGATCDDGLNCTGDGTCTNGNCAGATALPGIDDGIGCTVDACDEVNLVTHIPDSSICQPDACQVASCDPTDPYADPFSGCVLEALPITPDGLTCTTDACDPSTGQPVYQIAPDSCVIDGECRASGDVNPANPCVACNPSVSATTWTAVDDGTACDDGSFCNGDDSCFAGACTSHGETPCDDGLDCTIDSCTETDGCLTTDREGFCVVDGVCLSTADPACSPTATTDPTDTGRGDKDGGCGCSTTTGGSIAGPWAFVWLLAARRRGIGA